MTTKDIVDCEADQKNRDTDSYQHVWNKKSSIHITSLPDHPVRDDTGLYSLPY